MNRRGEYRQKPQRWLGFFLSVVTISCASVPRSVEDYPIGYRETGLASWYGEEFHGRPTANGEIYDMYGMTAAHRLMPLGTVVKVTHRENGRSVTVKVNDRGPFVRGRILDLSYGAAKSLGMIGTGTAPVAIEVASLPSGSAMFEQGLFTVQVGAFEIEENAKQLAQHLKKRYTDVYLVPVRTNQNTVYRVRVGALAQKRFAFQLAERLATEDRLDTFVIRRDP
ncbi:MAG: septal ring lytic transglycosylase RlpA family protein [Nitrospirae bacterium]|nr:septal ring lytic transglycosylase RlpA family protein [Nitrospirota bacterium]